MRWALLALSLFIFLSCTALCTHIDKACGDDGKGHCSICLIAARHVVPTSQPALGTPHLAVSELTVESEPRFLAQRFPSSLYIRPPPLS